MNIIEIRRKVLLNNVLNTAPVFEVYGYAIPAGNKEYNENETYAVTKLYHYPPSETKQTLVTSGVGSNIRLYNNNKGYMDYWNWQITPGYARTVINIHSEYVQMAVKIDEIENSYAYLRETGQILFAGKNTIYYGHKNIGELN